VSVLTDPGTFSLDHGFELLTLMSSRTMSGLSRAGWFSVDVKATYPGKLAALAARELPAILHALRELAPAGPGPSARRYSERDIQRNHASKRAKYAAIRQDASDHMSGRAIERKHHVGRRTIRKALASATLPARKKISREAAARSGLHRHIDTMIAADPQTTIAAIWERLAGEHGTTVVYATLRTYVSSRRSGTRQDPAGKINSDKVPAARQGRRRMQHSQR
jgi:hypothetical protein